MANSWTVLVLFVITTFTSNVSGLVVVTSCDSCHTHASCTPVLKESPLQADSLPTTFTCSCTEGFSGNGITCYNASTCSTLVASCCPDGYSWSEHGCHDIDECSGEKNPCTAPLQCKNKPGSYSCLAPDAYAKDMLDVELASNQVSCGGEVCSSAQDCLTVNGAPRCADPCQHYTILSDSWRSTNYKTSGSLHCDIGIKWQGWYRMYLGDASVQMPERCIQPNTCGTNAPIWLKSPPPSQSEGVVQATVCASWVAGCCNFEFSIGVKACPGNYYVYKLVAPPLCFLAYAADANSAVCDTCKKGESCVSADKITWTCKAPQGVSPELVCNRTTMMLGVPTSLKVSRSLDPLSGHMADPSCAAGKEVNGMVWYEVQSRQGVCGNVLRTNKTQAIYSNILYLYPVNIATFSLPTAFPFSCVYPLDSLTSMDLEVNPFLPTQESGLIGVGPSAHASMFLFHDNNFTSLYPPGPVTLPIGTPLYVGLNVQEVKSTHFSVVIEECYITDTADAKSSNRYYLIQNRCSLDRRDVIVNENGMSQTARFTALLYLYHGNYDKMFLQCHFSLCDKTTNSCSTRCQTRATRSISNHKSISIGPIIWTKGGQ